VGRFKGERVFGRVEIMTHPILIRIDDESSSITITGEKLQKLLGKPKPILLERKGQYFWVPIEKVRNAVAWYKRSQEVIYPYPDKIIFTLGDCVTIPKEAGEVIFKYNGHDDD